MGSINLGNIVGLIKSEAAPTKTFVIWAKILNPSFPNVVELHVFDATSSMWVPLKGDYIKLTINYSEFSTASAQNDINILTLPAGYKLEEIIVKHLDAAQGGSVSAATLTLGIAGELDKYSVEALDMFVAPSGTGFIHDTVNAIEDWDNTTDVRASMNVVGDTLDNVLSGEIEIYILIKRVKA